MLKAHSFFRTSPILKNILNRRALRKSPLKFEWSPVWFYLSNIDFLFVHLERHNFIPSFHIMIYL